MDTRIGARRFGTAAIIIALLMLGLALLTGRLAHSRGIEQAQVRNAVVRLAAVSGRPAAGYFSLEGGVTNDRLTGVTGSPGIRVELHESMTMHGAMSMIALKSVDVPANGQVAFAPGGKHLMIYGLPATMKPGTPVLLTFHFAKAGSVQIMATTRSASDAMDKTHS